ncbi:hypothetical protein SEA_CHARGERPOWER_62 [Mycobacterium phage Chargerpower]|nr:hypothetical protein SEA_CHARGERPOWER_62 [Mycobacterium phage Chargerpower]
MNVSFKIFGYEVASIDLDFGEHEHPPIKAVSKPVKCLSKLWVKGMTA